MGRIFSWPEVEARQIPELASFEMVGNVFRSLLVTCPEVVAALFCGSFIRGDHNIRSDIDCVILYEAKGRAEAVALLRELLVFARGLFVPVEMIPLSVELAATPHHHLAPTFLEHLSLSAMNGGVIKANPVPLICPRQTTFVEDTRDYLIHKMRKLEKGMVTIPVVSTERLFLFLQKVLDLPIYVARKLLRCHGIPLETDSKQEVLRLYPTLGITPAIAILEEVTRMDRVYSATLESQSRRPDEQRYREVIENLLTIIPNVLDFAQYNLLALQRLEP
jgi:hypothetical protein